MQVDGHILLIGGLSKIFGGLHALDGLDLAVKKRHIHALIGPNGSGKTTFFNVVTGLLKADGGKIQFLNSIDNADLTNLKPHVIARMGISRTFQDGRLAPNMTVLENVMCGMYSNTHTDLLGTYFRPPFVTSAQEARMSWQARELLELVGLDKMAERWAGDLVWVERQLVQLARAMAATPKLLLLDEPTGGMGVGESQRVEEIIQKMRDKTQMTVIMVAHDLRLVGSIADWVTVINFGKKISEGTVEHVRNDKIVLEAYLGEEEHS